MDRAARQEAFAAEGGFFDGNREALDDIYSRMVQNRTEQAKLLGYESFTPPGGYPYGAPRLHPGGYHSLPGTRWQGYRAVVKKLKEEQRGRIRCGKAGFL